MRSITIGLLCLLAGPALAQPVRPTLDLDAFAVRIVWVADRAELLQHAEAYGVPIGRASFGMLAEKRTLAFAILKRRGTEYICEIYSFRPERVDDDATTSMAHELLHCAFGDYHR